MDSTDGILVWIFGLLALIVFLATVTSWRIDEQAMKVCELSHTHDVCFQALNR